MTGKRKSNESSSKVITLKIARCSNEVDENSKHQPQMRTFHNIYKIGRKLGKGGFSEVYEGRTKDDQVYAVKDISKADLSPNDDDALKDEINILSSLSHPNIIKLYEVYNELEHYYLITELVEGGELFDRIVSKEFYNEREARDVCKIILKAIMYCHSKNIAHRDLKPENLLLVSRTNDRDIKIADFGFAKRVTSEQCLLTKCGTPGYVAPDILNDKPYGTKVDMWSLGVITYTLLGGYLPFDGENDRELFNKIKKGQYEFHSDFWADVSQDAKDLISKLLIVNPNERISANEALDSSWICGVDSQLESIDLGNNLQQFRKFNAKRKLRQAILTVMVTNKLTSLGNQLRKNRSTITSPSTRNLNI